MVQDCHQARHSAPPTPRATPAPTTHHGGGCGGGGDQPSWERAQSDSLPPIGDGALEGAGPPNPSFARGTALLELHGAPPVCRLRRKGGRRAAPLVPSPASPPAQRSPHPHGCHAGSDSGGTVDVSAGSLGGRTSWITDGGMIVDGGRQQSTDSLLQGVNCHHHDRGTLEDELASLWGHSRSSVSEVDKELDDSGFSGLPALLQPSGPPGNRRPSDLAADSDNAAMDTWPHHGTFGGRQDPMDGGRKGGCIYESAPPALRLGELMDAGTLADDEADDVADGVGVLCCELLAHNDVFEPHDDNDDASTNHCLGHQHLHRHLHRYLHQHQHPDIQLRSTADVGVGDPGAWGGQVMFASQQSAATTQDGNCFPVVSQPISTRTFRLRVLSTGW